MVELALEVNDRRALILDLNGVLQCYFRKLQRISPYIGELKEVSYYHGEHVFIMHGASKFLRWSINKFTAFIWSCIWLHNISKLLRDTFLDYENKLVGCFLSQQDCGKEEGNLKVPKIEWPIFYEFLKDFLHVHQMFNENNTLIVDDSTYKCFKNPHYYCLIIQKVAAMERLERQGFSLYRIVKWLWNWLLANFHPRYAMDNNLGLPLDKENLVVFCFIVQRKRQEH